MDLNNEKNAYEKSFEQIAAGLAHEVKNPLSLVRANIDLLELTDAGDTHKKSYQIMRREIERINDLLLDFIQFAKPIESESEKFELTPLITELIETVSAAHDRRRIAFILDDSRARDGMTIRGDANKIRRVLLNIIKNSIEAVEQTEAQSGRIKITVSKKKNFAKIVCKDNGKGFDPGDIEKMTPFYTTKQGGSGLGLFLSRAIIKEHHGLFDITGAVGQGCVVTIHLPLGTVQ